MDRLITDIWVPPGSPLAWLARGRLGRRLRDRFHPGLPSGQVTAFTWRALARETVAGLGGRSGRERDLARSTWWISTARNGLTRVLQPGQRVFCYCYEARELFAVARALGAVPVLGQIDPGPVEDRKVAEIVQRWPAYRSSFQPGSAAYYESWREECRLADRIVVNSEWSRMALEKAGNPADKIVVCPLIYAPPPEAGGHAKSYPRAFSSQRPLRALFLGQCILRKGIAETIEAAQRLADRPVEFTFVGNTDIAGLARHFGRARITHLPRVSRAECHAFYRAADVFLFPTHSDGFGLTQLEAQAWKLPIVTSDYCAQVVEDGRTGWVVPEVSSDAIVRVVEQMLAAPEVLARYSAAIAPWPFGLGQLGRLLTAPKDSPP